MKSIKVVGLVGLMALLAMALLGAPSAMAEPTGLCATEASESNPCESVISSVHQESVGSAVFLTSVANIECLVLFSGSVTEGSPLTIVANFTYTSCKEKTFGSKCEVKEVSGSTKINMLKEGHETAKVTLGTGETLINCTSLGVHCVYGATSVVGTAKGPLLSALKNGEVSFKNQPLTKVGGGFFCPESAAIDVVTTPLTATYIVGQMLCRIKVGGLYQDGSSEYICKNDVGKGNGEAELYS